MSSQRGQKEVSRRFVRNVFGALCGENFAVVFVWATNKQFSVIKLGVILSVFSPLDVKSL